MKGRSVLFPFQIDYFAHQFQGYKFKLHSIAQLPSTSVWIAIEQCTGEVYLINRIYNESPFVTLSFITVNVYANISTCRYVYLAVGTRVDMFSALGAAKLGLCYPSRTAVSIYVYKWVYILATMKRKVDSLFLSRMSQASLATQAHERCFLKFT